MRKIFLFFILLIPITSALEFFPASLQFDLEKNQISCKKINFEIESPATVRDAWAQSSLEQWSITNFKTNSQEHEIQLSYPSEINPEQKELEFCVSGSKPGEYKGALVFRQEKIGNSIVQFAVWLKLSINEKTPKDNQTIPSYSDDEDDGDSGSSGKSRKSNSNTQPVYSAPNPPKTSDFQKLDFPTTQEKIKLNQPQEELSNKQNSLILILTIPVLIAIFSFVLIISKNKKHNLSKRKRM